MASQKNIRSAKNALSRQIFRPEAGADARARSPAPPTQAPFGGVIGVGMGEKVVGGKGTGALCVKFYVIEKHDKTSLSPEARLPREINGVPTDVEAVGPFKAFQGATLTQSAAASAPAQRRSDPRSRMRPVQPGCSVGGLLQRNLRTAGTLGAWVSDQAGIYLLTSCHVLGSGGEALPVVAPSSKVFQPGMLHDAGGDDNLIARASRSIPLSEERPNYVDCAIALVDVQSPPLVAAEILEIGRRPGPVKPARIGMLVEKMGCRTGRTRGVVVMVEADLYIEIGSVKLNFRKQIAIQSMDGEPFADTGDSGALIVEQQTGAAIGLLCGGSSLEGKPLVIANPIGAVLSRLRVNLDSRL